MHLASKQAVFAYALVIGGGFAMHAWLSICARAHKRQLRKRAAEKARQAAEAAKRGKLRIERHQREQLQLGMLRDLGGGGNVTRLPTGMPRLVTFSEQTAQALGQEALAWQMANTYLGQKKPPQS